MQTPPISREAVRKRVARLGLPTKPGARGAVLVNIVAFNRAVKAETDPSQEFRNDRPVADDGPDAGRGSASYRESRAQREAYQAENARIDLEERLGKLLDLEEVVDKNMRIYRRTRDRLMALPATIADDLAAAPDASAIKVILSQELRRLMEALANDIEDMGEHMDDEEGEEDAEGPD